MKTEYETIVKTGLTLQVDCPDPAMGRQSTPPPPMARVEGDRYPRGQHPRSGVIDTTTNYEEHPELFAERIPRFADIVGRERVVAGTDCGFGTFAGSGVVQPTICQAKLTSPAKGATIALGRLW